MPVDLAVLVTSVGLKEEAVYWVAEKLTY
ncbi:hypothetical protein FG05_35142 [Fusarium graminearum]|nr:hypothetical protein FG05_35142 [Fusarium graminearum]